MQKCMFSIISGFLTNLLFWSHDIGGDWNTSSLASLFLVFQVDAQAKFGERGKVGGVGLGVVLRLLFGFEFDLGFFAPSSILLLFLVQTSVLLL